MSEQQNIDLIRRCYEAFGRGDIETLLSLCDKDIEWVSPGPPELATAGSRRGHKAVADFFAALSDAFEFDRFEPKEFIAQGERVVVLGEDTVRVKRSGTVIDGEWVHVFSIRNGKVVNFHEYADMSAIVAALGSVRAASA